MLPLLHGDHSLHISHPPITIQSPAVVCSPLGKLLSCLFWRTNWGFQCFFRFATLLSLPSLCSKCLAFQSSKLRREGQVLSFYLFLSSQGYQNRIVTSGHTHTHTHTLAILGNLSHQYWTDYNKKMQYEGEKRKLISAKNLWNQSDGKISFVWPNIHSQTPLNVS